MTRAADAGPAVLVVGDASMDVVARHDRPIVHGGDVRAEVTLMLGGAGANTASWLAHLGTDVTLVARVGTDPAGAQLRDGLSEHGVHCTFAVDERYPTGCVVVLVDAAGQRSMMGSRGANAHLAPADLDPALLRRAQHLHLSGYVLLDAGSRPAGLAMLAAARAAGLSTSVDPQAHALLPDTKTFLDWVRGVDLLLPNADELAALTGSADPASAAALLPAVGAVAVTTGGNGASWVDAAGCVSVPAAPGECVDSTGAGDAFDAGLLGAWLAGADPAAALRSGVTAGAAAVTRLGAQP